MISEIELVTEVSRVVAFDGLEPALLRAVDREPLTGEYSSSESCLATLDEEFGL